MRKFIGKPVDQTSKFKDRLGNPIYVGSLLNYLIVPGEQDLVVAYDQNADGQQQEDYLKLQVQDGTGRFVSDNISGLSAHYEVVKR